MKIAIFPGTFDPFTIGHIDIVKRATLLFDQVIILFSENSDKRRTFDQTQCMDHVDDYFLNEPKVTITSSNKLVVEVAKELGADCIIRGVRSVSDYEYEKKLAAINKQLSGIETLIMFTRSDLEYISSSFVRELYKYDKNYAKFALV